MQRNEFRAPEMGQPALSDGAAVTALRWAVFRDRLPFGPPELLGEVTAPTKEAAEFAAGPIYGGRILVQSLLSLEAMERELAALKNVEKRPATRKPPVKPPVTNRDGADKMREYQRAYYARRKGPQGVGPRRGPAPRFDWALGESLWRAGVPQYEIARQLGCSVATVYERRKGWTRGGDEPATRAVEPMGVRE